MKIITTGQIFLFNYNAEVVPNNLVNLCDFFPLWDISSY
jgi:hypothetical protein